MTALRIANNQTATIAEWDADLLSLELAGLQDVGFDLDLLGFDAEQLADFGVGTDRAPAPVAGLTPADDAPEPP